MNTTTATNNPRPSGWRLYLAGACVILSLGSAAFIPLVTSSNLSAELKATVSGLLLLGVPQVLMLAAVALVGKSGLNYLRGRMLGFAKTFTAPNTVGRIRYRIGLVLFVLPLFFGSLSPYLEIQVPLLSEQRELFAITGDGMFFLSFFVLGGDFWDKVRSLFVHDASAVLWNHDEKRFTPRLIGAPGALTRPRGVPWLDKRLHLNRPHQAGA